MRSLASIAVVMMACCAGAGAGACAQPADTSEETSADVTAPSAVVTTSYGKVQGIVSGAVSTFKGIPFAGTTGGNARWRAPQPAIPWSGVRTAATYGPKCLQPSDTNGVVGDEDCLSIDVWSPAAAGARLPVIVFFYGGFNATGSTSDSLFGKDMYDGAKLAQGGNAIVVTANYRVGVMGFLAHASLATTDAGGGNYGLMDQLEALRWVQKNVSAFGGDPTNLMVMGQSAGAFDTCTLVTSPAAKGLFERAGMNSGGCRALSRASGERAADKVATTLGCTGTSDAAACLRAKSAAELIKALPLADAYAGTSYWPVVDGVVLPKAPLEMINAGEHNKVPVLIGSNRDEASLIVRKFAPKKVASNDDFLAVMRASYGPLGDRVAATYPTASYDSPDAALQQVLADAAFTCPTRRAARALAAHAPVYKYEFTHATDDLLLVGYGASHGFELFFLFKNFVHLFPTPREKTLADSFAGYWSRFAATGDPNGAGAAQWALYDAPSDSNLTLDVTIAPGSGRQGPQCDFWDALTPTAGE